MEQTERVQQIFNSVDAMDTDGFLAFLTDEVRFRFGNMPPVVGKEAVRQAIEELFASIKGLNHRILRTWPHSDSVICQGEVTYTRTDDSQVTIPFVNVWGMEGERVKEYLVYIDITPLYSHQS